MSQPLHSERFTPFLQQEKLQRPRYRALFNYLQQRILGGELPSNSRLPSTRELAELLKLSRNTVKQVYEMLHSEGYIETRQGDGSYVALQLSLSQTQQARSQQPQIQPIQLSAMSAQLKEIRPLFHQDKQRLLLPAIPALDQFPWPAWQRSVGHAGRQMRFSRDRNFMGEPQLRNEIARYLNATRGIRCTTEQVMICSGSQQGMQLAFSMLLNPGDKVWVEDPGFPGIDGAISNAGGIKVSVPIDRHGFRADLALANPQAARLAFITPSRNFPLGYTLSIERRLQLLQWARTQGCCIIEDDYDSEFRFDGPPLTALQGLEGEHSVIYSGTFSRILHPAIRLAYLVLPPALVAPFNQMRGFLDGGLSSLPQLALADFMSRGLFAGHLRRMRKLYKARRAYLRQQVEQRFAGQLTLEPSDGGMHCVFLLPPDSDDNAIVTAAMQQGLGIRPLSYYYDQQSPLAGLVIGFAGYTEEQIDEGLARLKPIVTQQLAITHKHRS
ncbi:PLP-dependent aminotransferase family protein [Amphritea sp. 2_MG-2023]|uniref:MocR-like pyridoxine biosynthesis transcription factor PdxR n=1 Tax=Amphritea TaxID=515417 RepID=UPI001C074AA7|nr:MULTISPECIES: PLP-dependent aminotransferase family protein [Amphritea]MBU2966786.1 PLP-dependent aminotransferase family protein [Amphritea atlantica]MDO6420683.1 PLP-dependent aminotransferase family protein [Amphritea sp. 2_MG-2023]